MKENVIGVHVFSPVDKMKLVEIIPSRFTSDSVLQRTISLMEGLGKTVIVVKVLLILSGFPGFFHHPSFNEHVLRNILSLRE